MTTLRGSHTWQIYALRDPRNNRIRYIGITVGSLKTRLATHLHDGCGRRRRDWILDLARSRQKPTIEPLALFDGTHIEARDAEVAWMDLVEAKFGAELLNDHRCPPGGKALRAAIANGYARAARPAGVTGARGR
jgi:hypothetical protein